VVNSTLGDEFVRWRPGPVQNWKWQFRIVTSDERQRTPEWKVPGNRWFPTNKKPSMVAVASTPSQMIASSSIEEGAKEPIVTRL
jgi:hypothetical protein